MAINEKVSYGIMRESENMTSASTGRFFFVGDRWQNGMWLSYKSG